MFIPVFEGGSNVANVRSAHARQNEVSTEYRETVLSTFREADTALGDLRERTLQAGGRKHAQHPRWTKVIAVVPRSDVECRDLLCEHVGVIHDRRGCEQFRRFCQEQRRQFSREVPLPVTLAFEGVKNAERTSAEVQRKLHRRLRFALDDRQPLQEELSDFLHLVGLGFDADHEGFFNHGVSG